MTALDRYEAERRALDAQIAATMDAAKKHALRQQAARLSAKINQLTRRMTTHNGAKQP